MKKLTFVLLFTFTALIYSFASAESKVFKSELGFSFAYTVEPSTKVEKIGLDEQSGAIIFHFTNSFNLAAEIAVYDSQLSGNKNKNKVDSLLKKDLKTFAKDKFNSYASEECKKDKDLPQCEYEPKTSGFKKITFGGQPAYTFFVETNPMGYNITIVDYNKRKYVIKNGETLRNFKFE